MVKVISKGIVFFVLSFLFISFVSASFTLGKINYSIEKSYGFNDKISGWINISFNKEPTTSIFTSTIGNEKDTITLLNLLKKDSNFVYTCDAFNCDSNYIGSESEAVKTFSLDKGASKMIGLKITEKKDVSDFSKFSLNVTSDSTTESDNNPLSIDILNDGKEEWVAYVPSGVFSTSNYGCYKNTYVLRLVDIPTDYPYCERIELAKSPSVKIGANIEGLGTGEFTMSIEDDEGNYATCTATRDTPTATASCIPEDFITIKENYSVCVQAELAGNKINSTDANPSPCGFSDSITKGYTADFEIFAQTNKYAPIGEIVLNYSNSELATGNAVDIEGEIEAYISERYNNNCSKDCIIPIKITSGINHKLIVKGAHLSYATGGTIINEWRNVYTLSETPAKITSGFQKLILDYAEFNTPNKYDNYTFFLLLGDTKVVSEKIEVKAGPIIIYVSPSSTAVNYPTEFKVVLNKSASDIRYEWDFGDGTKQNTTTNKVTHTYETIGAYDLKTTVVDAIGRSSSKMIRVEVKSASEMVPALFEKLKENAGNLPAEIKELDISKFEQDSINTSLKLNEINTILAELQTSISQANTEEAFQKILGQMVALGIPKALEKTFSGKGVFYSEAENINLATLKEIGGGDNTLGSEEAYKNAVIAWENANIKTDLNFSQVSATYDSYTAPFLKTFTMKIKKSEGSPYLIIKKVENLLFAGNYGEKTVGSYVYIPLSEPEKTISFSTTDESVSFSTLPAFISPGISELTIVEGETVTPFEEGKMVLTNPKLFFVIIIIVLASALIIWVSLQIWYVKRYEDYLFKNKNNLYNVVNYLDTEKKTGSSDKDISAKLKKTGWTAEQIQYALKKYSGKKTWFQRTFIDRKKVPRNAVEGNTQGKLN